MSQTEITESVPLLDGAGRPQNFGWARGPLFEYDRKLLKSPRGRVGEGDRYVLFSPGRIVVFEILDDGCLGYVFASVISLKDKTRSSHITVTPFPLGTYGLPNGSESGSVKFARKKILLNFAAMEGGARIIKADFPRLGHRHSIRGEVVLTPPEGAESLVTNMPWRGKRGAFACLRRSPCYFAEGVIQFGSHEIVFTRGNSWGIFDWNRGVRPRADLRFWAAGCGEIDGRVAGFSVGRSSADSSGGTENAFFLDGILHKLDRVSFHIPSDRLMPWRFTGGDNRLEMTFTPREERDENHSMFFYSRKRRQLFGSFSGKVILDGGREFTFRNITGMAERVRSRL